MEPFTNVSAASAVRARASVATSALLRLRSRRSPCGSRRRGSGLQELPDVMDEQIRVLVEEAVAGVRVDAQLGVREMLGEQVTVARVHHRVVVAVDYEHRLSDRREAFELGRVRDAPCGERSQLCIACLTIGRLIPVGLTRANAP